MSRKGVDWKEHLEEWARQMDWTSVSWERWVGWEKRKRRIILKEDAYVLLSVYLLEKRKKPLIQQEIIVYATLRFGISNKTTVRALDILAKHGLVEIRRGATFPFRIYIRTTEKGRAIAKLLEKIIIILADGGER